MKEIFAGVFEEEGKLFTKNLLPGEKVYGERLVSVKNIEYRQWDHFRSKLAAAIKNGLKELPLDTGTNVLYLGAAEGTTLSHVSDVIGETGVVFGVDISERVMRKFIQVCEQRQNVVPIIADANKPWKYKGFIGSKEIGFLYQDVAQPNQAQIFLKNAEYFLKKGNSGILVIKARSISQQSNVEGIIKNEISALRHSFRVNQIVNLKPFEKDHVLVLCERI